MKSKIFLVIATAIGISAVATTAVSVPLPAGTKLTIIKGVEDPAAPTTPCTVGSCFGVYLFAGLYAWTPLGPGTDGGIIIGKGQKSGGQETNSLSSNNGELTEAWSFGGSYGTFFTAPSDAGNVFDDQSCTGSGCGSNTTPRLTDLAVWNMAWNGNVIPLGSAAGCNPADTPACTADELAGIFVSSWTIDPAGTVPRKYKLFYDQVLSGSQFKNFPYRLILRGDVACIPDACDGLVVIVVSPSSLVGAYGIPIPFTINVIDPSGPAPTCRVGTPPANGAVALNGCASGTYTGDVGFVGTNTFTIIANNSFIDSQPALVNVAVTAPTVSPTPTPTCTYGPHPQPTIVPLYYSTTTGQPVSWDAPATNCSITPPANGTATLIDAATCQGSYTSNSGFVGRDTFGYSYSAYVYESGSHCGYATISGSVNIDVCAANDKKCPSYTPTPTATPPILTECTDQYPLRQATLIGKQGHLSVIVTGNLVSVNPNGKEIKICPTTTATYNASTNTPGATVVCQVKSNTGRGQGHLKVNDHIKCTDKPVGNDKVHIKIKSGVYQKVM